MSLQSLARFVICVVGSSCLAALAAEPAKDVPRKLAFVADGKLLRFDTGLVKGLLRGGDKAPSQGITSLAYGQQELPVAAFYGLVSHYRLLDANARYGTAAWDWASQAELLADGRVQVRWKADAEHPFDLAAVYAWTAADTLDVTTTVTGQRDLVGLEVYLASYCHGFPASFVYARQGADASIIEATRKAGEWQIFPRDERAVQLLSDGRWKRQPHPVEWAVGPALAAPLGLRRDAATGMAVLVMAPAEDCFAVSMPYGEEWHRSIYLSLFGRDVAAGQTATARARLVIAHNVTDQQAIEMYRRYEREARAALRGTPRWRRWTARGGHSLLDPSTSRQCRAACSR